MRIITGAEIDYIHADIKKRGVEIEDLQLNLLDHICCLLEEEMEPEDDFEKAYEDIIRRFYQKELKEIEYETNQLLTFKNFYGMKKSMIFSGIFSAAFFTLGSIFKIMHWPGAGIMLVSAMMVFSLVFLPLVLLLKNREAGTARQKLLLSLVTIVGILYVLSAMFLLQHWPGARIMWFVTLILSAFVVMPLYFFSGIRRAETKLNTIVTTVILFGILGIQFTMTALRPSPNVEAKVFTYLQSEQWLAQASKDTNATANDEIKLLCARMKSLILEDMGMKAIPEDFDPRAIRETGPESSVFSDGEGLVLLQQLKGKIEQYNAAPSTRPIPTEYTILNDRLARQNFCSNLFALNNLTQIQLYVSAR